MNIPRKEVEQFTDQIVGRGFDMLFDSFEAYDVQETRRLSREEGRLEKRVEIICNVAAKYAPDYDVDKIMEEMKNRNLVQ